MLNKLSVPFFVFALSFTLFGTDKAMASSQKFVSNKFDVCGQEEVSFELVATNKKLSVTDLSTKKVYRSKLDDEGHAEFKGFTNSGTSWEAQVQISGNAGTIEIYVSMAGCGGKGEIKLES